MHPITIRCATVADAELIADISRQTFYETFAAHNSKADMDKFMNEQFTREALVKEAGEKESIFLLAYDETVPVGYARIREGETRIEFGGLAAFEIARIYAIQQAIGKGVGKALMQKTIEIAIENKKEIIWLGVWEKNERAIAFYNKFGFTKFAEHSFLLGDDLQTDWLMMKML